MKKSISNSYNSHENINTDITHSNPTMNLMSENKNFHNNSTPVNNLISNSVANPALSDVDRPPHSYIALISMAILSKPERKILLNEIYDWVIQNFPYYQYRTDKSWRNSIRHNLSLNECFIKVGKAGNGRGYYWSIHGANMVDFKKGDFRRRQARLRAKHDKSSKNSENSKSKKNQQNIELINRLPCEPTLQPTLNQSTPTTYQKSSFSSPTMTNQTYYQNQSYSQQNLSLATNQDYQIHQNSSPNSSSHNLQYNSYSNMYHTKPMNQQLNSFNYSNDNSLTQYKSYEDPNNTYNHYTTELPLDNHNESKFIIPNNTNLFNDSLLTKANTNINTSHTKLQGSNSLSTSPSSSTSSTSSQSSHNHQYFYQQAYQSQPNSTQVMPNNQQPNSQYNQYINSTFPWLPSTGNTAAQSNFLETLTSAAVNNPAVPSYDLNSFPYHNSQIHRI